MSLEILRSVNWDDRSVYSVGALALTAFLGWQASRRSVRPTPPGPRKLPLVGNILAMPTSRLWEVHRDWAAEYGDLIYLEGLGKKILAVNSFELAHELLVTRAANYSDRGWSPVSDMIGFQWAVGNMDYGKTWRDHRRAFHRLLNQTQIPQYSSIIVQENVRFLQRLLLNPKNFREDVKLLFGAIIMRVSYGNDNLEYNKQLIKEAQKMGEGFMEYSTPGRILATTFPSLQYVPSWLPGTGWKRAIEHLRVLCGKVREDGFADLKVRMREGVRGDYNVGEQLVAALPNEDDPTYQYELSIAQNVAANSFVAGADTTISSALALILALAMYPAVQKKVQKELEAIVGNERIPSFEDLERLPYLHAVIKEVSRWHTVVPYGVPHSSTNDDVLNGYHIPAGTLIFTNNWAIMHDPAVFEDPMEFKPERYFKDGKLNADLLDPDDVTFGYGRRICPGRHLSNAGLTMMAASLLSFFDIQQAIDDDGNRLPLKYGLLSESTLLTFPAVFYCDIVPRSPRHTEIIHSLNL